MRIGIIALMVVFITTAQKCSEDQYSVVQGEIISVSAPDTVIVGSAFTVFVEFSGGTNGCAEAYRLEVTDSESGAVIVPFYRKPNDLNVICTMAIPVHELNTEVQASTIGSFVLRNETGDLLKEIRVVKPTNE